MDEFRPMQREGQPGTLALGLGGLSWQGGLARGLLDLHCHAKNALFFPADGGLLPWPSDKLCMGLGELERVQRTSRKTVSGVWEKSPVRMG